MKRLMPVAKLALFLILAVWLGSVVQRLPERFTVSLPDQGVTVSVPKNLEGWVLEPGEGDLLVKGHTGTGLVSLEIVKVPATREEEVQRYMEKRHKELRPGKEEYVVWHQGIDSKFGQRRAQTYKATYQGPIWGPFKGEIWQYDSYWPHRGQYVRISMRYPNFLLNYIQPDKAFIASHIQLEN